MKKRRGVAGVVAVWVATLAVVRIGIAPPEHCPTVTVADVRGAAAATVGWFAENQRDDGSWVYRFNRVTGEEEPGYNVVRHSGAALALYQAATAGFDGALETADAGVRWSIAPGRLIRHTGWAAVADGSQAPTGATALLVTALAQRVVATGSAGPFDSQLKALGRFLVDMVTPSGAVSQGWDVVRSEAEPAGGELFHTGETLFALAYLATVDPEGGWVEPARRVAHYIASERDAEEDRWPPFSDHWAAYGFAQLEKGAGVPLTAIERAYADRLAGLMGIQIRYESTRTGSGLNRLVRGGFAPPAGIATVGEGLGALSRLGDASVTPRLQCAASIIVRRQTPAGAWFRGDVTQVDDQQHSLSALLGALPALAGNVAGGGAGGQQHPTGEGGWGFTIFLALIAFAAVNPARLSERSWKAGAIAGLAGVTLALVADWLLRTTDVSAATAAIAAGVVVGMEAIVDQLRRTPERLAPAIGLARVGPALVVIAVAASRGTAQGIVVGVAAGAAAVVPVPAPAVTARLFGAIALAGAVTLTTNGILSV